MIIIVAVVAIVAVVVAIAILVLAVVLFATSPIWAPFAIYFWAISEQLNRSSYP